MKRLFSRDVVTGVETWFHDDPGIDGFHLETKQLCDPILEDNKRFQAHFDGWTPSRNMRHAACIPMILLHQWAEEVGISLHDEAMGEVIKLKLNDPEYRHLRTGVFQI